MSGQHGGRVESRVSAAGQQLEVISLGEAGGNRAPIVMLHEGLGSVSLWRDFPERVAQATGRRVIAYSRAGYGQSGPRTQAYDVDFMHREAMVVLPALLDALAIDRPILLGHSDGASIALIHAGCRSRAVTALALMAPHVFVEDLTVRSIAVAKISWDSTDLRARLARHHADVDSAFRGWNDIWLRPDFLNWNIQDVLPTIACPVLVIQGNDDEYGSMAQVDAIVATVPDVDAVRLADCRHSPHRDQPDAVLAALLAFSARLP
jgi:pimeloyl-ACP methyl ester carboxylesterase